MIRVKKKDDILGKKEIVVPNPKKHKHDLTFQRCTPEYFSLYTKWKDVPKP